MASDEEEGGAEAVLREEVEEAPGPGIVGAVVVGEGELRGIVSGDQGAAEELRLRIHGRVGAGSGGQSGGGESDEHLRTV